VIVLTPIATAQTTRRLLQELKLSPNKSLGQNFLISTPVAKRIEQAAQIKDSGHVLEIGPGLGALSEILAEKAGALTLLELDGRLYLHLSRLFADNPTVEVINGDALSFHYTAYATARKWREYQVVANLPYNITSVLVQNLLLNGGPWHSLTLMVQQEVAQKLLSAHFGEAEGPLALLLQYYGLGKMLFTVPPASFFPAPQIDSAVVQVIRHPQPPFAVADAEMFWRFLNAAFSHRRKTLVNSLNDHFGNGGGFWRQALLSCGLTENRRAEQLSLHEYGALFALPQVQEYLL